jgi:hypothetical protein
MLRAGIPIIEIPESDSLRQCGDIPSVLDIEISKAASATLPVTETRAKLRHRGAASCPIAQQQAAI